VNLVLGGAAVYRCDDRLLLKALATEGHCGCNNSFSVISAPRPI